MMMMMMMIIIYLYDVGTVEVSPRSLPVPCFSLMYTASSIAHYTHSRTHAHTQT